MNNISKETIEIFELIKVFGPVRSSEIVRKTGVSIKTVYKHLAKLLDEELIQKTGTTPRVFYSVSKSKQRPKTINNSTDWLIEQNYIYVSPSGQIIRGIDGFNVWCSKNKFDVDKENKLFLSRFKQIQKLKKDGLISAKKNILYNQKKLALDDIFFHDFYTFNHFGKTKLGQLVYLGKSAQNKELIQEVAREVRPVLMQLIQKKAIKTISFIPPTVDRKIQFMSVLEKELKLDLNRVSAEKIAAPIKIPQKTLRKLDDRMINARETITVNPNQKIIPNILIIDDATGSGATLNETAKKLKNISPKGTKIYGYSVVGSYKGFDVISEV